MARVLYISYFGVREPLVQTQVLPYLRELTAAGHRITLLTFDARAGTTELGADSMSDIRGRLAEEDIEWHSLPYHKRFSVVATAWDIFRGTWFVRRFISRERPDILHGRVHVPTLMGALGRKLSKHKPKLLFDIRGFFPEEYTDAGIWPEGGWLYRSAKRVERWLMSEADGFVVLTEKARAILFPESKATGFDQLGRAVEVIPCCVDLQKFDARTRLHREDVRGEIGAGDRITIVYVGSFGGWYLSEEMVEFFKVAREINQEIFILVLTQRDKENAQARLLDAGFDARDFYVGSVPHHEIPQYLAASDLAVSFIKACYSKQSSSPTKLAEYLAAGLPVIANSGVGDVDELLTSNRVGYILPGLDRASYEQALKTLIGQSDVSDRCRLTAQNEFDLERVGGVRYNSVYDRMLKGGSKKS